MVRGLSILILVHNKAPYTRRCLDSLWFSDPRPDQIVVVDNGSSDDTPELLAAFHRRASGEGLDAELLRFPENRGAIVGRNAGLDRLKGAYWVFLDNDVVVRSRRWLAQLRATLEIAPQMGVAAPKLVYADPPHRIQCAGCDVTAGGRVVFRGRGRPREEPEWNAPRDCQSLISACWMLRADAARRIGPLDERFSPVQFEDIDYCYRLRAAGWTCRYEPGVEMYHFENVTTGRTPALNYSYLTVKNGLKFKEKWRHVFSTEGGPPDGAWSWAEVPQVRLEDVPASLEMLD